MRYEILSERGLLCADLQQLNDRMLNTNMNLNIKLITLKITELASKRTTTKIRRAFYIKTVINLGLRL